MRIHYSSIKDSYLCHWVKCAWYLSFIIVSTDFIDVCIEKNYSCVVFRPLRLNYTHPAVCSLCGSFENYVNFIYRNYLKY